MAPGYTTLALVAIHTQIWYLIFQGIAENFYSRIKHFCAWSICCRIEKTFIKNILEISLQLFGRVRLVKSHCIHGTLLIACVHNFAPCYVCKINIISSFLHFNIKDKLIITFDLNDTHPALVIIAWLHFTARCSRTSSDGYITYNKRFF